MPTSVTDTAELLLAAIVEWSDDAIVSKDLNGIIKSWNRAAERMFGYTAREAVGKPILLIIPLERRQEEDEVLRRIRHGQAVDHFETVRQRKDGTLLDVSLTISPVRTAEGTIIGASKIARDITAQKRTARMLAEMQARLMALVDASSTLLESPQVDAVLSATISIAREQLTADGYALWRTHPNGLWRAARSFGVSREFADRVLTDRERNTDTPVAFSEPLVIEDVTKAPLLAAQVDAYRAEGICSMLVFPLTIAHVRSGTLVFYYRTPRQFSTVDVQSGRALANLAATAITTAELYDEQRAFREAAEQGRHRAAFLAEASTVFSASLDYERTLSTVASLAVPHVADWCAVDVMDDDGRVRRLATAHVNPANVELARTLRERYPDDPDAAGGVYQVLRTGKPAVMLDIPPVLIDRAARDEEHLRLLRALDFRSYMCLPLTVRGRTFGAMTFVMAESGRRYRDEDVRFAENLASRAALAVENARAYQRVNEAGRLKDEFLATLSHELRTPLNAILGYARMARRGMAMEEQARALEVIERNATSLNQIIEDVLDVSRIVSGKLRLNVQPVHLPDVLNHAVASVLPAATAKGVTLQTIIDPFVGHISGDPDRLQQVVWNLLSNAMKFTPKGGRVEVRLERLNSQVEIVVKDTGQGIEPQFLPHVFERFRQADAGLARNHGGLGLGLAIVRDLVEMHGGSAHAESGGLGRGATFRVILPVMAVHALPAAAADNTDVPPPVVPREKRVTDDHRLDAVRVLAVDDEKDSLSLLKTILQAAGAEVRTAGSAEEAMRELEREIPDVLVSDLGMPGTDGLALIRRLRQSPSATLQSLPALALTAYARPEDRVTALASGYQMHVTKPADPVELVVTVLALARDRRA